jgi:hypothetical protein
MAAFAGWRSSGFDPIARFSPNGPFRRIDPHQLR